ncbi:MAG: type IV secretion system protein [Alphaproteobacteria bacterium]
MNNGQQANDTLYENGIGWALMLVIFGVLLWVFWFFWAVEIREMVRWIRYGEAWLVSWFLGSDYQVPFAGGEVAFHKYFNMIPDYQKEQLEMKHLALFGALAMQPLKYVFVLITGAGALWCMFCGPNTQYRTRMSIENLIGAQSKVFPVISPFIKFNPSTQPPRPPGAPVPAELPLFAEALGPEEWLAFNSIQTPDGEIEKGSANQAFIEQLGKPWRGVKALDPYKQVLLAAFCLKASRQRAPADNMLGRLAQCWAMDNTLNLAKDAKLVKEARAVLQDKKLAGAALSQANRHAFETTAILRAMQYAREEGGVLAPAQFVWLRAYNRELWYPLNNLGRQSFHMEALGAMSHFKAEKLTQRPIPVPKVDGAVDTIQEYMKSGQARPIPQLDYSKSKKRGIKKAV